VTIIKSFYTVSVSLVRHNHSASSCRRHKVLSRNRGFGVDDKTGSLRQFCAVALITSNF